MNNKTTIAVIAAILIILGAGYATARSAQNGFWRGMMGGQGYGGMMGGQGYGGMMGGQGYGGIIGNGSAYNNHCGTAGTDDNASTNPITIEDAKASVDQFLAKKGNEDLQLAEIIQFSNHFYAGIKEKSTGKYAFELIVNKYSGALVPEMGPNMMWNTKYGMMRIGDTEQKVTEEQALKNAQTYLDKTLPGTKVEEADAFYGYYTMEVLKEGQIYGMLSVNDNTGSVWYHTWHGSFEKVLEVS